MKSKANRYVAYLVLTSGLSFAGLSTALSTYSHEKPENTGSTLLDAGIPETGQPNGDSNPAYKESGSEVQSSTVGQAGPAMVPVPSGEGQGFGNDGCEGSGADAAEAGYRLLSCDPLRLMPISEWDQKVYSPNFRYNEALYCFDESNFAGTFAEQHGSADIVEQLGYDPYWLSEVKLDNGCSFFFHPTQGRENANPEPKE